MERWVERGFFSPIAEFGIWPLLQPMEGEEMQSSVLFQGMNSFLTSISCSVKLSVLQRKGENDWVNFLSFTFL